MLSSNLWLVGHAACSDFADWARTFRIIEELSVSFTGGWFRKGGRAAVLTR